MNTSEVKKIQDTFVEKASGKLSKVEVDQQLEKINAEITNIHNCEACLLLDKNKRSNSEDHYRESIHASEQSIDEIFRSLDTGLQQESASGSVDTDTKKRVDDLHNTVNTLKASVDELLKKLTPAS